LLYLNIVFFEERSHRDNLVFKLFDIDLIYPLGVFLVGYWVLACHKIDKNNLIVIYTGKYCISGMFYEYY